MKNIISIILDLIAFCIRVITYIIAIFCMITFLIFIYTSLSIFPLFLAFLKTAILITGICILCAWAFLRKKRDTFKCPNKDKNVVFDCGQPYACDACPYNKENK